MKSENENEMRVAGDRQMKPALGRIGRVIRVIAIILLITVFAGIVFVAAEKNASFVTLPDGMRAELLEAVPAGTTVTTEKPWNSLVRRFLPRAVQKWIGPGFSGSFGSNSNDLAVVLRVVSPLAPPDLDPRACYPSEDATGRRLPCPTSWGMHRRRVAHFIGADSFLYVYGLPLHYFPRNQKDFEFHLTATNGAPAGSLRVPNPFWAQTNHSVPFFP